MRQDATSLDRLHDLVVPQPTSWWPPAPGWYWVLGFLLLAAIVIFVRLVLSWQRNRYRRDALSELKRKQLAFDDPNRRATAIAWLAELLKRTALSAWPRETVASLTGSSWLSFLDQSANTKSFSEKHGDLLEAISYNPRAANSLSETETRELVRLARHWVKHHRVK